MHMCYYDTKYTSSYDRVFTCLPNSSPFSNSLKVTNQANSTVSSIQRKISGHPLFFRASASCSKILNNNKYTFNTVNSGQPLFFRARASCSKILNVKSIFNTVARYFSSSLLPSSAFYQAQCSLLHTCNGLVSSLQATDE